MTRPASRARARSVKSASAAGATGQARPIARKPVSFYYHDTGKHEAHRWPLDWLLLMIQHHQPQQADWPDRTFVIGRKGEYLAISTTGPRRFGGQHPVWDGKDKIRGAMLFDGLTFQHVRQILARCYAGRPAERCFTPRRGRFQPYFARKPGAGSAPNKRQGGSR